MDTHLLFALFEEFQDFLVEQRTLPLDDLPEEEVAPEQISPDPHGAGQPEERQDSTEIGQIWLGFVSSGKLNRASTGAVCPAADGKG